jgi:predicted NUDIX family NTP pyrophosphohydrolase
MAATSAGLLLYRRMPAGPEVLLVHPGGPFWAKKDLGAWSVPKGLVEADEPPLEAARREFTEETGFRPDGPFVELGAFRQSSAKTILVFALEADFDVSKLTSNAFTMEWPPRSGKFASFPEVDRAAWFNLPEARRRILKGQVAVLETLERKIGA